MRDLGGIAQRMVDRGIPPGPPGSLLSRRLGGRFTARLRRGPGSAHPVHRIPYCLNHVSSRTSPIVPELPAPDLIMKA
eukprot:766008-Hanusia_phi.AAC.1